MDLTSGGPVTDAAAPPAGPVAPDVAAWLAWQQHQHPQQIALGLERVRAVWSRLGPARLSCPLITVGGTNGKGSCVAMLEGMLRAGQYRTGCYSSPHLLRYNERIRLNACPVTDAALCDAFARVERARGTTPLTYFEFGTLAAVDLFLRAQVEVIILEVGLGGRLDAVNLWDADVAVVTSIGMDHTAWLGDSLDAIAGEKAGIFRPGRPAIIGQTDAPPALRAAAEAVGALPLQLGREMTAEPTAAGWMWRGADGTALAMPVPALRGAIQRDNASCAIAALRALGERLPLAVAELRQGLQRTQVPGRFQVFPGAVSWILDVAHNGPAAEALAATLRGFQCAGRRRALLGVLADKDPVAIVAPLLPHVQDWILTQPDDPRAMPVTQLAARLQEGLGLDRGRCIAPLAAALAVAEQSAAAGDCILVCGSFTTVGAALARLDAGRSGDPCGIREHEVAEGAGGR